VGYYFRVRGNANGTSSNWTRTGHTITIGAPTGPYTLSGNLGFSGSANGPLYVQAASVTTGTKYTASIQYPVSPQSYTIVGLPADTYTLSAFIDQNNDGMNDAGDSTTSHLPAALLPTVTLTGGNLTGQDFTLPSSNANASVGTAQWQAAGLGGGFNLAFRLWDGTQQIASATLVSGPDVLAPLDLAYNAFDSAWILGANLNQDRPSVGAVYGFQVTYTNGNTETVNATVTAVLDSFAGGLAPAGSGNGSGTGTDVQPVFTWSAPVAPPAGGYTYSFGLQPQGAGSFLWQVENLPASTTSLTWGTDPGNAGNAPAATSLAVGVPYQWYLTVLDTQGNSVQQWVTYMP
jgi:hypothetical protein